MAGGIFLAAQQLMAQPKMYKYTKMYRFIKWFINDCSIGLALIIIGILIGWSLNTLIYNVYNLIQRI